MTYRFFTSMFFLSSVVHAVLCAAMGKQFNIFVPIFVGLIAAGIYDIYVQMNMPDVHTINVYHVNPEDYEDELTCEDCGSHDVEWECDEKFYCDDCMNKKIAKDFQDHFKNEK